MRLLLKQSMRVVLMCMLAVVLSLGLSGCIFFVKQSGLPSVDAAALHDGTFSLADSYNQILGYLKNGVPVPAAARPDDQPGVKDGANNVAGVDSQSRRVSNERGFVYVADGESLDVREGSTSGKAVQTLNLYTYANIGGEAVSIAYSGNTLAVLFATEAGLHYPSTDYTLSAYNAPRSMVLLFDANKADELVFDKAIGMTGVPRAVAIRNGILYVAATHKATPDVTDGGQWITQGRDFNQVSGYANSLELRSDDPVSYVPSYFEDGVLTPLRPQQIYLSEYGNLTIATVIGAFSLTDRSCVEMFAFYDPGALEDKGLEITAFDVNTEGFSFSYEVDYLGKPAVITAFAPIGTDGKIVGLGRVDWSEPNH